MRAQQIHSIFKLWYYSLVFIRGMYLWLCVTGRLLGSLCLITPSNEPAVQRVWNMGAVDKFFFFIAVARFHSLKVLHGEKGCASYPTLVYRPAQISAVLLWACSGWNAKLSSQHCSTFHSQSQQTCALWSISGPGIQVLFVQYFWGERGKKKKEKNVSYFFLSLWQRVTFFDVSTEALYYSACCQMPW